MELDALRPGDLAPELGLAVRDPGSVRTLGAGVLALPLLTAQACERWLAEIHAARSSGSGLAAPNSMHEHGVPLQPLGFGPRIDALLLRLRPLLAHGFGQFGGASLDSHHSYLVEYGRGLDEELAWHADDSEVTINLCLGERFHGAELTFLGLRCDEHRQTRPAAEEIFTHEHAPGLAVIHAGRHRHRVEPITSGVRRNLIIWARSSSERSRASGAHPSWCPVARERGRA